MHKLPFVVCSARLEILFALKFYCICHIPSIIWGGGGSPSVRPDSPTGSPQHTQWLIYLYSLAVQSVSVGRVPAVSPRLKPERLLHFILLIQRFKAPAITIRMIALLQACIHFEQFTWQSIPICEFTIVIPK